MSSPSIGSVDLSTSPTAANAARKRQVPNAPVCSANETLNQMTQEAEARHQDKYTVQKEMRAIRAKEMEKQRKEDEEREREESSRFNRPSTNSTSTGSHTHDHTTTSLSSLPPKQRIYSSSTNSTRNDESSAVIDQDNPRELKKKIAEMEDKFKKHAIYQTQLENDNQKLIYEVDLLKDLIEEHQELIIELRRQFKEKSRELDCQKRTNKDLQTDFARLKEILKQRDALIEDSGLVLYTDYETKTKNPTPGSAKAGIKSTNDSNSKEKDALNEMKSLLPAVLVAPETAKLLDMLGDGTIDDKLRKLFGEKQELKELNSKLQNELNDERDKKTELEKKIIANAHKMLDNHESNQEIHEIQRQYTKEINDLKMKIQKLEHENIIIKQDKQRLDTQLKYLQTNFDELENTERRLIKEKRDAQRELNESKILINDLQLKLEVLQKTLEKKRNASKYIQDTSSSSFATSTTSLGSCSSTNSLLLSSTSTLNSLATPSSMPASQSSSSTTLTGNQTDQVITTTMSSDLNSASVVINPSTPKSTQRKSSATTIQNDSLKPETTTTTTAASTVSESSSSPTISSSSNTSSSSSSPTQTQNDNHHNDDHTIINSHTNKANFHLIGTTPNKIVNGNDQEDVFIDSKNGREMP